VTRSGRGRRGGSVVEFAMIFPMFLILVLGIAEYGWFLFVRANVQAAAREGCRAAAVIPPPGPDDAGGHEGPGVAEAAMESVLNRAGVGCPPGGDCDASAVLSGTLPAQQMTCKVDLVYPALTGLIPINTDMQAVAIARMEVQQ
jgi:hypothetical protein